MQGWEERRTCHPLWEKAGTGGAAWPATRPQDVRAQSGLRPQARAPKHPRSPAWMRGSLSEVHGLIAWRGGPFCPHKVLVASHQPQGPAEGLGAWEGPN